MVVGGKRDGVSWRRCPRGGATRLDTEEQAWDLPLGSGTSLTPRLREETLEESKYSLAGSSQRFNQDSRVILTFLQVIWDYVLRPLGMYGHSLSSGPLQRKS